MAPKRKRSPRGSPRARSRSRSPEKKQTTKERTTKTAKYAAKSQGVTYGTKADMSRALKSAIGPNRESDRITPDVLKIMEEYGNFHECDGPTKVGKLCLKGKAYFNSAHKMDCTSYCGEEKQCHEWMSNLLQKIPPSLTIQNVEGKIAKTAGIKHMEFDFIIEESKGVKPNWFQMRKIIDPKTLQEKKMLQKTDLELKFPYMWGIDGDHIRRDDFLISDEDAVKLFCKNIKKVQPWGPKHFLRVDVMYFIHRPNDLQRGDEVAIRDKLPLFLSNHLKETMFFSLVYDSLHLKFIFRM